MTIDQDFPIGTQIAIDRFPHDTSKPSHSVTGYEGSMLKIKPIGKEHLTYTGHKSKSGTQFFIETLIPVSDVVKF